MWSRPRLLVPMTATRTRFGGARPERPLGTAGEAEPEAGGGARPQEIPAVDQVVHGVGGARSRRPVTLHGGPAFVQSARAIRGAGGMACRRRGPGRLSGRMSRRLPVICLLAAWLCASGAMLDVAQLVAWARMFAGYARTESVLSAARDTFDPARPCAICCAVCRAREAAGQHAPAVPPAGRDKLVLILERAAPFVPESGLLAWPWRLRARGRAHRRRSRASAEDGRSVVGFLSPGSPVPPTGGAVPAGPSP